MRARVLYTYGSEAGFIVRHFEKYLQTLDNDTYQEAEWATYRLKIAGDALTQGVNEESGAMYHELARTARILEWEFSPFRLPSGRQNTTIIDNAMEPLDQISQAILSGSFSHLKNKDPIEHLEELSQLGLAPNANEIIGYCEQIQEIFS